MTNGGAREEVLHWFERQMFSTGKHWKTVEREGAKRWKFTTRQARNYMKLVRDRWRVNRLDNVDGVRDELDGVQHEVLQRAMKRGGKLSDANQAVRNLMVLHGVVGPTEVTVSGHLTATAEVLHGDPEKDRARLEELRQREAERKKDGG